MHDLIGRRLPIPLLVGAVLIGVLAILPVGKAMAFFDSMKVNLFSDMKGVVTLNGEPVAGAVVKRLADPGNKKYRDEKITDAQGRFSFPRMEMHTVWKLLPAAVVISQKVTIEYEEQEYLAWAMEAYNGRYQGELNNIRILGTGDEVDIDLVCELTGEESRKKGAGVRVIEGMCVWQDATIIRKDS